MDDNQFWVRIGILGAICALGFASCTVYVVQNDNAALLEMTSKGANPIAAKCALTGNATAPVCVAQAIRS